MSILCIDDHHLDEKNEICGGICKSIISIFSEIFVLGILLEILIFYDQWTNLHDRLQNERKKPVTNDFLVWSLTFIEHVNTNSIDMWAILSSNADWDCSKTQILQGILKIQNLLRVEHCAFLEVIHLFRCDGCVRDKLQFRTVQQNKKSFLWIQDWDWMIFSHLIYGIWSSQLLGTRIRVMKIRTTCQWVNVKFVFVFLTRFTITSNFKEWLMIWIMLILFFQTSNLLKKQLCYLFLRTTKQWSKWP